MVGGLIDVLCNSVKTFVIYVNVYISMGDSLSNKRVFTDIQM